MNLGMTEYIMMGFGALSLLVWMIFYFAGLKHNSLFEMLDEKEYPLKEIYGLGYAVLETVQYGYRSKSDRKLRKYLEVLYGNKYCEYYLRVVRAQQLTFSLTLFFVAFVFYGFVGEITGLLLGLVFVWIAYYYYGTLAEEKIKKRSNELLHDFSEVVSKLALLTNAGMILREAWELVAFGGEGTIYEEMRTAVNDMQNGKSDIDAIHNFGRRCMIPEVKKFTSTIVQGIAKGNSELTGMLQEQSREVWELKKQLVRREGEKASSKLLLPICLMFLGILIMIMVPIFTNMGI